jgi:pimeloyl-ACP methyl ester carboxylesterase
VALIEQALSEQGVDQVDIVSHSWGGFLSRWCIEELGMGDQVRQLITICTPHQGTWATRLGIGSPRRDMMIGSPVVRMFKTAPPVPKYATIWANCDEIVCPPQFSLLGDPDGNPVFTRIFEKVSHLSMLRNKEVARLVARLLEDPSAWDTQSEI